MSKKTAASTHERQRNYVRQIVHDGFDFGLTVARAFIESIRDLGYRSTGTALNENIDNAAEAGAENVHIAFGFNEKSRKPARLAIMDDGIGMVPEMIRAAVVWGGTDRHGSRELFGRYGYGLPSSAVSQGRKFSVYSRTDTGEFHVVVMDLDEIAEGKYIHNNRVQVPEPAVAELPGFVIDYAESTFPGGLDALRTVIVWDKLDRLSFTRTEYLENHLLETCGLTYRNQLRVLKIAVNGKAVEPVDPLFITEGARLYDIDNDRAEPEEPITFEVRNKESRETKGTVRVRFSVMPPGFGSIDKSKKATKNNQNGRYPILKEHNGLIVLRAGRQVDVVRSGLPTTFSNNDRYVGVEIDFPPTLDEYFGVTTHKQQITLSENVINMLDAHGVWKTLDRLRQRWREMDADLTAEYDLPGDEAVRPSETAMAAAAELDPVAPESERRTKQAEEGRQEAVDELVDKGVPRDDAEKLIDSVEKTRPFRVTMERNPEGPFYRVDLRGGQVVLIINTTHRFYTDVYAAVKGPEGARIRQALEVVLFVLAKSEIDSTDQRQLFYQSERIEWSRRLTAALASLDTIIDAHPDEDSMVEAITEMQ